MKKLKVMSVFGTRPDAVKMAPLVKELCKHPGIEPIVCVTAQHRQMLDQVLEVFDILPHFDLDIMQDRQSLEHITINALEGLAAVMDKSHPQAVLVHGDTTTCFAAALAAFYRKIKVAHVEAGLRTYDIYSPFPEEMNRKLTDAISGIYFAPTRANKDNLLKEGVKAEAVYITGNTVIDALRTTVGKDYAFTDPVLRAIDFRNKKVIVVTAHRRENLGKPLVQICRALQDIALRHPDVVIVYAVHLNPLVRETVFGLLGENPQIRLLDPLGVRDMHNLMDRSYMIMTDSGGLQEEAPALGKPVLVLRDKTERPEAVKAGTVKLAGTDASRIISLASLLLESETVYRQMARAINPYGDGSASKRIVNALLYEFGMTDERPGDFNAPA